MIRRVEITTNDEQPMEISDLCTHFNNFHTDIGYASKKDLTQLLQFKCIDIIAKYNAHNQAVRA